MALERGRRLTDADYFPSNNFNASNGKFVCFLVASCGRPARPPPTPPLSPSRPVSSSGQSSRHPFTFSSCSLWAKLFRALKTIFWPAAEIRKEGRKKNKVFKLSVVSKLGSDPRSWCYYYHYYYCGGSGSAKRNYIQLQIIWPKTQKQENYAIPNVFFGFFPAGTNQKYCMQYFLVFCL